MGTQYNGIPDTLAPILPTAVSIASSTDTTPISITTFTPHNLTTGDRVGVYGHTVNTHANGSWKAQVVSTTILQLVGSTATGAGAGGATGNVQSMGLGPTYAIPTDSDPDSGATFDVPFEALGDRSTLNAANIGRFRTMAPQQPLAIDDNSVENTAWQTLSVTTFSIWTPALARPLTTGGSGPVLTNLQPRDVITFSLSATALHSTVANILLGLFVAFAPAGGTMGGAIKVSGSGKYVEPAAQGDAVMLQGTFVVPSGANDMNIYLAYWSDLGTPFNVQMIGDASLLVDVKRPTDFAGRVT